MKNGVISLLLLGLVAVLLLVGMTIIGPWELPGFGQLSQRQIDQAIFAAEANSPTIPPNDSDQDGFDDETEEYLRTDRSDNCADDSNDSAWPPDLNNDKLVNNTDIDLIKTRLFKKAVGQNRRYDLNRDKTINVGDVIVLGKFFNKGCPFQFLNAGAKGDGVEFSWKPGDLTGSIFGYNLTKNPAISCESGTVEIVAVAFTAGVRSGQSYWTWDKNAGGDKYVYGDQYCAFLVGKPGAVSSGVIFTPSAPTPSPSTSPPPPNGFLNVNSIGASAVPISGTQQGTSGTTSYTITFTSNPINTTLTAPEKWGNWVFSNWNGCNSTSGTNCTVIVNTGEAKAVAAIYYSSP